MAPTKTSKPPIPSVLKIEWRDGGHEVRCNTMKDFLQIKSVLGLEQVLFNVKALPLSISLTDRDLIAMCLGSKLLRKKINANKLDDTQLLSIIIEHRLRGIYDLQDVEVETGK